MLLDILKSNRGEVLNALDSAQSSLQATIDLIEREDWPELRAKLEAAREKRMWWEERKRAASNDVMRCDSYALLIRGSHELDNQPLFISAR